MIDLIRREDAIEALRKAYFDKDIQSTKDDPCIVDAMTDWAIRQIKALPSTEPTTEEVWSVAQKVFCSTLTYREAIDYLKELEKQHERFNQQNRCDRGAENE